jgi:hypothetical protein
MEPSAVGTGLLCHLAGEPTRVLTEIDFELPPAQEGKGEQGIQELGAEFVSPSPGEPLATCLPRAVSRGLGACRRPTGRTWQPARRRTLARASALRQQAARHVVSSSITAMSDVSPEGARSIRPTSPCSVAAVISPSTDAATDARRRPHVRCPVSTDAAVCVTHFSLAGPLHSWPQQSDRLHLRLCVDPIAKASVQAPRRGFGEPQVPRDERGRDPHWWSRRHVRGAVS